MTDSTQKHAPISLTGVVQDIQSHIAAWRGIMKDYIESLPPDREPDGHTEGSFDRSYVEHELQAMTRHLNDLYDAVSSNEAYRLLKLFNDKFKENPTSAKNFDDDFIRRVNEYVENHKVAVIQRGQ